MSTLIAAEIVTVGGLPLHPLVVHLVVVIVPLTVIGAFVMAIWPRLSRRFGPLIAIGAALGLVAVVIAREAGEQLAPISGVSQDHMNWGYRAPWWIGAFCIAVIVFWLVDRGIPANRPRPLWVHIFAGVMVLLGVMALIQVIGAGHSGSEAVWGSLIQ